MGAKTRGTTFFSRAFVRDTLVTTGVSSLGKAVGLLIPFFIAAWFGTTFVTDAFFFVYGLVIFLASIFASTVSSVIVPYIAELLRHKRGIGEFVSSVILLSSLLLGLFLLVSGGVLVACLALFSPFSRESLELVGLMMLEMVPLVILLVWTGILEGTLQAGKKFVVPSLSLILRAAVTLGCIWALRTSLDIHAVVLGYMAGELARLALLCAVSALSRFFTFRFHLEVSPRLKDFLRKALFQILGVTAMGLNPIIDRTMAAWLPSGNVSVLYYGDRLWNIPVTFMVTGLLVTLLSYWSGRHAGRSPRDLERDVALTARWVAVPALLLSAGAVAFAGPLVALAYGRGAMSAETLAAVARVAACYFLGFAPYIVAQVYVRGLIVCRQTKPLMLAAFIFCGGNVVGNLVLMTFLGVQGIALSTSAVNVAAFFILRLAFKRTIVRVKEITPVPEGPVGPAEIDGAGG